jgi:hypothetical protein
MRNECFLYVMQDMHKWQGLQNLRFTSAGGACSCAGGPGAAKPARPPVPSLSDDEEDRASLVRGSTRQDDAWLGHTTQRRDASDAEDEPGFVEEGARSRSPILNILRLNLQSATSTTLYALRFRLSV